MTTPVLLTSPTFPSKHRRRHTLPAITANAWLTAQFRSLIHSLLKSCHTQAIAHQLYRLVAQLACHAELRHLTPAWEALPSSPNKSCLPSTAVPLAETCHKEGPLQSTLEWSGVMPCLQNAADVLICNASQLDLSPFEATDPCWYRGQHHRSLNQVRSNSLCSVSARCKKICKSHCNLLQPSRNPDLHQIPQRSRPLRAHPNWKTIWSSNGAG